MVDAICTPTVGIASDKTRLKYGRRKSWHLIGSIAGILSFPFILSDPCAAKTPSAPKRPLPCARHLSPRCLPQLHDLRELARRWIHGRGRDGSTSIRRL